MSRDVDDALAQWGPERPLTEPELELLAQFEREGLSVAGLEMTKRDDGSTCVTAVQ